MPAVVERKCARQAGLAFWAAGLLVLFLTGCSTESKPAQVSWTTNNIPVSLSNAVLSVRMKFAPDTHLSIFKVDILRNGRHFALKGDVENPAAKIEAVAAARRSGFKVADEIDVLPDPKLGDKLWGVTTLSVVNVREKAGNPMEMGTQMLTGEAFKVWKKQTNWYLVQTPDDYVGWVEGGGFYNCTRAEADAWLASPLLIVTDYEERILEKPEIDAPVVSDVVMGCRVKRIGDSGDWFEVGLADGRTGFLPKKAAANYAEWQKSRQPTPENIERTARQFLGRPYSWGCNSIRGLDCSGLTKFVFFLNGIDLKRNASEQCLQGAEVPLGDNYSHLKKGDLLFFGHRAHNGKPEHVDHTAIYLGDKLFIQSSEMVRISSLDTASPLSDEKRIRSLLHARRILPDESASR